LAREALFGLSVGLISVFGSWSKALTAFKLPLGQAILLKIRLYHFATKNQ
jgi:hypothetical protein